MNLTASIGQEQAFTYKCDDHPECGKAWHIITPSQLRAMREADDPEWYFIASHIPEIWEAEWDWDNPIVQRPTR